MKYIYIYIYLLLSIGINSQNLINNGSFESITAPLDCNNSNFYQVNNWKQIFTPDLFSNNCGFGSYQGSLPLSYAGSLLPIQGNQVCGMTVFYAIGDGGSECFYQKLSQVLKKDFIYCMEYNVIKSWNCDYSISNIDAWFSEFDPLLNAVPWLQVLNPQIKNNTGIITSSSDWILVRDTFIAKGNEHYVTIGNFTSNLNVISNYVNSPNHFLLDSSAYYFFDDISLIEIQPNLCKNDTVICKGDSLVLGLNQTETATYSWQPNTGLSCNTCPNPKASPSTTTKYKVIKQNCNVTIKDSIIVTVNTNCNPIVIDQTISIPNVFTPNNDGVNDTFKIDLKNATLIDFTIYNRWGNKEHSASNTQHNVLIWTGRTTSGEPCAAGVYFYTLQYKTAEGDIEKKNGYISLFR